MAILDSIIPFKGRLGNVISYVRNGKHCLRTVPESVRQTANTRRAAKWFGAASRKGALIRNAFAPEIDIQPDRVLVNRLNSYILSAGRNNHAGLTKFRFNGYTGLSKHFSGRLVFSKDGKLHIPEQRLQAYGGAIRMEVKLIATRIDFSTRTITGTDVALLNIDLNQPVQPFEGAEMSVDVPGKGTLVVVVQVRLFTKDFEIRNRKYQVADIVAVVEEEVPQVTVRTKAQPHKKLTRIPAVPVRKTAPAQNGQAAIQRE